MIWCETDEIYDLMLILMKLGVVDEGIVDARVMDFDLGGEG